MPEFDEKRRWIALADSKDMLREYIARYDERMRSLLEQGVIPNEYQTYR